MVIMEENPRRTDYKNRELPPVHYVTIERNILSNNIRVIRREVILTSENGYGSEKVIREGKVKKRWTTEEPFRNMDLKITATWIVNILDNTRRLRLGIARDKRVYNHRYYLIDLPIPIIKKKNNIDTLYMLCYYKLSTQDLSLSRKDIEYSVFITKNVKKLYKDI
jgi:hypothetical protein